MPPPDDAPAPAPLDPATRVAQALRHVDPVNGSIVPPIDMATTFARNADYAPRAGYIYGRDGGATVETVEAVLADLDGAAETVAFSSGMAAFVALTETLKTGERIAVPRVMYQGGLNWLRRLAARRGIGLDLFETGGPEGLAAALRPGETRLVWAETPTNPTWDVIDIAAAAEAAHAAGALIAVDCTVAPPCTTRALALGADIAFHSATKYLSGHSDLTAGALSFARRDDLVAEVRGVRTMQGGILAPFEAWLLLRGLRTLFLRYERASANALAIAQHFEAHPAVARVLYPGLPSHPGHAEAARQMTGGFGGMLSLMVAGDPARARDVARFVRVLLPATSLGGVESLIEHRRTVEGPLSEVPEALLRISTGIEDVGDLVADLEQALERAGCGR